MTWDRLRSTYDAVAAAYDERFAAELDGKPRDRELLAAFAAAVDDPVIDLGCGPGQIGAFVQGHGRRVVGVDLSPVMAARAAARLGTAAAGDIRAVPVRDGAAGGVVAFYSLIHLRREELSAGWSEVARVLRPGGRALVSVHEGEGVIEVEDLLGHAVPFVATLFGLDEVVGAATAAGLDVVAAERRPPYPDEHPTTRLYVEAVRPA